jgi:hypothetical protein
MKLMEEISNLRDVMRAVQCLLDRINPMLEYQENPIEHFHIPNPNEGPDCYPMSAAEKDWWSDLKAILISQRNCIEARLQVLTREPNYVKIQEDLAEWQRDTEELNRVVGKARDNFDREAYNAARAELKRLAKFRFDHRKALRELESPPGKCWLQWLIDEHFSTRTGANSAEIDKLVESFATKLSIGNDEDKEEEDSGESQVAQGKAAD